MVENLLESLYMGEQGEELSQPLQRAQQQGCLSESFILKSDNQKVTKF